MSPASNSTSSSSAPDCHQQATVGPVPQDSVHPAPASNLVVDAASPDSTTEFNETLSASKWNPANCKPDASSPVTGAAPMGAPQETLASADRPRTQPAPIEDAASAVRTSTGLYSPSAAFNSEFDTDASVGLTAPQSHLRTPPGIPISSVDPIMGFITDCLGKSSERRATLDSICGIPANVVTKGQRMLPRAHNLAQWRLRFEKRLQRNGLTDYYDMTTEAICRYPKVFINFDMDLRDQLVTYIGNEISADTEDLTLRELVAVLTRVLVPMEVAHNMHKLSLRYTTDSDTLSSALQQLTDAAGRLRDDIHPVAYFQFVLDTAMCNSGIRRPWNTLSNKTTDYSRFLSIQDVNRYVVNDACSTEIDDLLRQKFLGSRRKPRTNDNSSAKPTTDQNSNSNPTDTRTARARSQNTRPAPRTVAHVL